MFRVVSIVGLGMWLSMFSGLLFAHGVNTGDQGYIQEINGVNIIPFIYLGAKHMVTGYDHLLFLLGVIFSYIAFLILEFMSVYLH